jgi:NADPH:quinone reductase-like Zn-dependent oxidoreductase
VRAVVATDIGGPDVLAVWDVPKPKPLPTEVLVRVEAAGVNPVDSQTRSGSGMHSVLGDPPFVVGWDVAGVVEAVGMGVTRFAVGDEVFGMPWLPRQAAAYAEYVTAPSRHFAPKPSSLSFAEAGALPLASLTAWQSLVDTAAVGPGTRVLIHAAAGGVGHLAVQIAKARGAHVLGTASAAKHSFLESLGVDEPIDYRSVDFTSVASDIDVVLDLIGTDDYQLRSLSVLRPGGLLLQIAEDISDAVRTAATEQGKSVVDPLVEPDHAALEEIARLADEGKLRVEIEREFPLEEAAAAQELSESGGVSGKVVLVP